MTYHKINYTKTTWKTYVWHRLQGQFIGFLIALLKQATDFEFLISTGTSSQIMGVIWGNVSEPNVHSLFYTTQLQELEYFDDALKRNNQFLKVLKRWFAITIDYL